MKRTLLSLTALISLALCVSAQTYMSADTYYSNKLDGKSGSGLVSALHSLINSHTNVGYDGLWEVYDDSDTDPNGYYYDIYSEGCKFSSSSQKCGNYSQVCDCYNREHSLPKSWWGKGKSPQYSDAYHLYPTDGKVNNYRSAYALGECANGLTQMQKDKKADPNNNGRGKLGSSTFSGYSGTVFEPIDKVKGNLARSYFYMVICYNDIDFTSGAGNSTFTYSGKKADLTDYGVNLLLKWHRQDPVSQHERERNNAVAKHQHNRNPFIDYPELAEYIWGNKKGQAFSTTTALEDSYITPEYRIQERHLTSEANMNVFDLMGRHIASGSDIELPAAGMYLVRFNNNTCVKLIVK